MASLQDLDARLKVASFLSGPQVGKEDWEAYDNLSPGSFEGLENIKRWHRYMSSIIKQRPSSKGAAAPTTATTTTATAAPAAAAPARKGGDGPCHPGTCPHSLLGQVDLGGAITRGTHPPWYPPVKGVDMGLKVMNTLTGDLEPFVPGNGRRVLWYTCGPTVYDTCHMGHARAYLTFDILRRIVEDYFGYEVLYQCNITDIDDKIILRARRNKLIDDYEAKHSVASGKADFKTIATDVDAAIKAKQSSMDKKLERLSQPPADPTDSRAIEEAEVELKQHILKMGQLTGVKRMAAIIGELNEKGISAVVAKHAAPLAKKVKLSFEEKDAANSLAQGVEAAIEALDELDVLTDKQKEDKNVIEEIQTIVGHLKAAASSSTSKALIECARDPLGEALDKELGHTVTDQSIFNAHARKFEQDYHEDMAALGVKEPDVLTRVTEYVPQIVDYIKKICDKGLAYASNGSVYLDITAFKESGHHYRKLEPFSGDTSEAMMAESEGSLGGGGEKRSANDFALWKASKPGEPFWPSPWGDGRPGWHIECSVVAGDILGANMDVHAGGQDLKFPHHDNELAQSEAYYGNHQWVNYFFHAGHLNIKGLKMSKSLKNFIKIKQALEKHSARLLRMMFLLQPWNKSMNYSDQTVGDARSKESTFKNFFGNVKALLRTDWLAYEQLPIIAKTEVGWRHPQEDRALYMMIADTQTKVHESFCNNFDTGSAIVAMYDLVGYINKYLKTPNRMPAVLLIKKAAVYITRMFRVVGLVDGNEDIGWGVGGGEGGGEAAVAPFIDALVAFRDTVRNCARAKASPVDFLKASDEVRDTAMVDLGVRLEDRAGEATLWKREDPAQLKRDIEAQRAQQQEAARKKKANLITKKEKELAKHEAAMTPPSELFKSSGDYGSFNDDGLPLTTKDGTEIKKATAKKLTKSLAKHTKAHNALLKTAGGDIPAFIAKIKSELVELRK